MLKKLKQIFKRMNIFNRLKEWQKVSLTIILGIIIASGGFFGFYFATNPTFRNNILGYTTGQNAITVGRNAYLQEQVNDINSLLGNFDRTDDYYNEYSFADLDIYPDSYVQRVFNTQERANGLISGAGGDPDGDGLPNKLEFFYGSNPKSARTLCEGKEIGEKPYDTFPFVCDNRNDRQLIDDFVSPLTGLDLDTVDKFRVLNQDLSIINNMKTSFEKASEDGISLSTLYQQSFFVDYTDTIEEYDIIVLEDKAVNVLEYRSFRFDVLDVLVGDSEISSISQIYTATEAEQFDSLAFQYEGVLERIKAIGAPRIYETTHRLYHLLFESLIEFSDHRKAGIELETTDTEEFKNASQEITTKIGWVYRRLKEEGAENDSKFT